MKKVVSILIVLLVVSMCFSISYATIDDVTTIITAMQGASDINQVAQAGSNIMNTINNVIGLLQIAGTGISLLVITMMGIKYMLASPSEKADTKKMIMPVIIGCILVFGGVNLMVAVAELSTVLDF